ncbi:MAG: 50S ribosomal protein L6 [Lysobacterales bacterium]|nr:MAG: 50S ribosomal protein L6 [Xanthomonadales bacterium]
MSRIGKMPVPVPSAVDVTIEGSTVTVKGPKGKMTREFNSGMAITLKDGAVLVERPNDERHNKALHGLTRALINNMVVGVTEGYSKTLEIRGTGYRAELQGKTLVLNLGFSHPVILEPLEGLEFEANPRASTVTVKGYDKELVGRIAAEIRAWRPVEPYLGKGIRYIDEVVRRKAGKTGQA